MILVLNPATAAMKMSRERHLAGIGAKKYVKSEDSHRGLGHVVVDRWGLLIRKTENVACIIQMCALQNSHKNDSTPEITAQMLDNNDDMLSCTL